MRKVLDPTKGNVEGMVIIVEARGQSATASLDFGTHQFGEGLGDGRTIAMLLLKPIAHAKPFHSGRVVHLVESEWENELRDAGGQCLGGGADSAVMHDACAARK